MHNGRQLSFYYGKPQLNLTNYEKANCERRRVDCRLSFLRRGFPSFGAGRIKHRFRLGGSYGKRFRRRFVGILESVGFDILRKNKGRRGRLRIGHKFCSSQFRIPRRGHYIPDSHWRQRRQCGRGRIRSQFLQRISLPRRLRVHFLDDRNVRS